MKVLCSIHVGYARLSHAACYLPCPYQALSLPLPEAAGKGFALGLLEDPPPPPQGSSAHPRVAEPSPLRWAPTDSNPKDRILGEIKAAITEVITSVTSTGSYLRWFIAWGKRRD